MKPNEDELKSQIAESLCEMSDEVITRKPPFIDIPIKQETTGTIYSGLMQYWDDLDSDYRESLLDILKKLSRYLIEKKIMRTRQAFGLEFPSEYKKIKEFNSYLLAKSSSSYSIHYPVENKKKVIRFTSIAKKAVKSSGLNYSYKKHKSGVLFFESEFDSDRKLEFLIAKGTYGRSFSFVIGMNSPFFRIRPIDFWGGGNATFEYDTAEQAEKQLDCAIAMLEVLEREFRKRLKAVFDKI